jgi:NADPH:quinone reductase-like Zn-dependent oxidoreductase
VIATSSSDDKLERAKRLGATHGINYKRNAEWDKAAVELTGGRGVDQVVEVGGAGTFARSLGAIRSGGKISVIGVLSGQAEVNPTLILVRRANVQGISVGSTQMFEAMNRAIAAGGLKPIIDKVFGFDEAPAAYRHLQSASHFGKVVISFG